jgi:membrane-associated phospholipid phosphatase
MTINFRHWLIVTFVILGAIGLSIFFIDQPIAVLTHQYFRQPALFEASVHWPEPFIPLALFILLAGGLFSLASQRMTYGARTIVLCAASVLWASTFKTFLKFVFGRNWPETMHDKASFIRDGLYEFRLFSGGLGFESFPSGHMAVLTAICVMLAIRIPRLMPIVSALLVAGGSGLILMNYHFVSDVLAGGLVGYTTSILTAHAWHRTAAQKA